jgi:hypothetical protein
MLLTVYKKINIIHRRKQTNKQKKLELIRYSTINLVMQAIRGWSAYDLQSITNLQTFSACQHQKWWANDVSRFV